MTVAMTRPTGSDHSQAAQTPRVQVRNLSKIYRTRRGQHVALDNVSIDIGAGEFVVLLGPSGCGKTTLLRCIAGLEEPDGGEISINGKLVYSSRTGVSVPPEGRALNMVFQSYALWPHMSVVDNVAYPLRNTRVSSGEARARAAETLELVGLGAFTAAYPGQLSGGQQQRVALARSIVSNDGLVLFDEPLSNLDAKVRDRLRVELLNLQSRIGFSAVYVTHDQMEALALADRVAVMDVGRIAQIGSARDIYDRPTSRYVADFVGSANEIAGRIAEVEGGIVLETPMGRLTGVAGSDRLGRGDTAIAMVRPEHCLIGQSGAAASGNQVEGVVERSLYLGPVIQHFVMVGDQQLAVSVSGGEGLKPGSRVAIGFAPDRTRIFAA
ncbi:MAG: ABC transporter ATP-binding protein [Devosia sp.]